MSHVNPGNLIYFIIDLFGGVQNFGAFYMWVFVVGSFVAALTWGRHKELAVKRDIQRFLDQVAQLGPTDSPRMVVDQWFHAHSASPLAPFWAQYVAALGHFAGAGDSLPDITRYFSQYNLVYVAANRRLIDAVPGVLTMLGILGTFLGLVAGLHGLSLSNPGSISNGIGQLIGGLSLKFTSSVYGIILALFWILLDKAVWHPRLMDAVMRLQNRLEDLFPVPEEERLLQQLHALGVEQRDNLTTLVNDALIPRLIEGLGEALDRVLVPHLQSLAEQQTATHSGMMNVVEHMTAVTRNTAQDQVDTLNSLAHDYIDKISGQSIGFLTQFQSALDQTVATQDKMVGAVDDMVASVFRLSGQLDDTAKRQVLLLERTETVSQSLLDNAVQWDAVDTRLNALARTLDRTIDQLGQRLEATLEAAARREADRAEQTSAFIASTNDLLHAIGSHTADFVHQSQDVATQIAEHARSLESSTAQLTGALRQLEIRTQGTVEQLQNRLASGLARTFEQFDDELSRAIDHLARGIGELERVIGAMSQPVEHMKSLERAITMDTAQLSQAVVNVIDSLEQLSREMVWPAVAARAQGENP